MSFVSLVNPKFAWKPIFFRAVGKMTQVFTGSTEMDLPAADKREICDVRSGLTFVHFSFRSRC